MRNLIELLERCDALGIRLTPVGGSDLTIDAPGDSLTPKLIEDLRTHKAAILAVLAGYDPPAHPTGDVLDPSESPQPQADDLETIDANKVSPCPTCHCLEVWENIRGDWRCLRCDPPKLWRAFAARYRITRR